MSGRLNHRRLQVHVGDWQKLTRHLTLAQRGAADILRELAWTHGGLDPDPRKLARMVGCRSDHWRTRYAEEVLALFELRDGLLVYGPDADQRARATAVDNQAELPLSGVAPVPTQCSPPRTEKAKEINGHPRAPTRAAPDLLKKQESLVGSSGDSDARAAGSAGRESQPAAARVEVGPQPRASPAGSAGIAPMLGRKPLAASRSRPRDGPPDGLTPLVSVLEAVVSDELRARLTSLGRAIGGRGG